jgi:hypothetical protein
MSGGGGGRGGGAGNRLDALFTTVVSQRSQSYDVSLRFVLGTFRGDHSGGGGGGGSTRPATGAEAAGVTDAKSSKSRKKWPVKRKAAGAAPSADAAAASAPVDEELAIASVRCSLSDPLTLSRIGTPVRGVACTHLAAFDLRTFLLYNLEKEEAARMCHPNDPTAQASKPAHIHSVDPQCARACIH